MKSARKPKRSYRKPRLKVHGDLRKLTGSKAGSAGDGSGKPHTKVTGAPA